MIIEKIKNEVINFCKYLNLEYTAIISNKINKNININIIPSKNIPIYIGTRGENIKHIEYLINLIVRKNKNFTKFNINIDIDEYKSKKKKKLFNIIMKKIELLESTKSFQIMPFLSLEDNKLVNKFIELNYINYKTENVIEKNGNKALKIDFRNN
jgi:predicted RNA-binding protein Jag